ncbi:MAG: magnesium transporter [Pseudomonadota bacterium]
MSENLLHSRVETIRRLARRGAVRPLANILQKTRAEDVAATMPHLAPAEQRFVFQHIEDDETAAELLARVGETDLANLVRELEVPRLVELLDAMEMDDETDVIARLPEDIRERVMALIQRADREQVEELLAWPDDSAGGIMQPAAFRLNEDATCREAIQALQESGDVEQVFYLYVENGQGQLVGVVSLRNLLTRPPNTPLHEVMVSDVISVPPHMDQEEVSRIVSRYDFLAVPVVDEHRRMLGIVTVDDIIDVIKEEAVEDMMLMVGVHQDDPGDQPVGVLKSARQRVTWQLIALLGGVFVAEIARLWADDIRVLPLLAGFLPVVIGMGGNVGSQAATITVRGIALGHVEPRDLLRVVWREARVGLMLGLGYGVLLSAYCWLRFDRLFFGLGVGAAILAAMATAAIAGSVIPLTLQRMRVDPAAATMPFVTTLMDLLGVIIYFGVTTTVIALAP